MKIFILLIFLSACSSTDKATKHKSTLYYQHGTDLLNEKDYNGALISLRKAYDYDSENSMVQNNLGMAYHFKERDDLAIKYLQESAKLGNTDAKNNLATIYLGQKEYDKAFNLYQEALNDLTYGYKFRIYHNLGTLELARHNQNKAVDYFKLAIKEFPDNCASHFKLGEIAESRRDYKSAYQKYYDASKGTCINDPNPLIKQAEILIKLKDKDLALTKLEFVMNNFADTTYYNTAKKMVQDLNVSSFRVNSF